MIPGGLELLVVVLLFLLLFGYNLLPNTGRNLGKAVAELRHADERGQEDPES